MSIEDELTAAETLRDTAKIALEEAELHYEAVEGLITMDVAQQIENPTRDRVAAKLAQEKVRIGSNLYAAVRSLMRSKALALRAQARADHFKRAYFDAARHYA